MNSRVRLAVLVALVLPLVVAPEVGAEPGTPVPRCSPAPIDCSGWYRTNVTISWQYDTNGLTATQGCNVQTITSDTADSPQACRVFYGPAEYAWTAHIKRDATAPQITAATLARVPDANGWYSKPVALGVSGSDATSGLASCDQPTYAGPDSGSASVATTCRDVAGNTATASVALRYDATAPSVAAAPDRAPDGKGWYRKPLTVTFSGADATSGVESCTQPARYAGPDKAQVAIAGTCRDRAGNSATASLTTNYDATAPKLAGVAVEVQAEKRVARVRWKKPSDAVLVLIDRSPGVNGRKKTRVYKGTGQSFVDKTVRKGVRYRYEVLASDAAGNVAGTAVTATARPTLYAPLAGAVVRAPVRLAWEPFKGARFYNVQLFRGKTKVLSLWPTTARLRLPKAWRYLGRKQTLRTGRYTWFVWPALGTRAKPRYGRPLGSSTFVIRGGA